MTVYATTKEVLQFAEGYLLRVLNVPPFVAWLRREFWHPFAYIAEGMGVFIDNLVRIVFYSFFFPALFAYVSYKLGLTSDQIRVNSVLGLATGFFVVLFSLPSTFAHSGVADTYVQALTDDLLDRLNSKAELDALTDNLKAMEACAATRVKTLRWALAAVWGAALFGYSQSMTILTKLLTHDQLGDLMTGSVAFFVIAFFVGLVPLVAIAGYRRSNEIVFRGLQFACNEVARKLNDEAEILKQASGNSTLQLAHSV